MEKGQKRKIHVSRWKGLSIEKIQSVTGHKAWKRKRGLFYAKGGAGIEKNPLSLRKPVGYMDSDNTGNRKGIRRERSVGEIREFTGFSSW